MARRQARRQRIRKAAILISFLLFPITMYYFSPYIIIDGAMRGIVNGSFIAFGLMFLSALFVGRLWCGWACPAGGLQDACFAIQDKPARGGKLDWIKSGIWVPWMGIIAVTATPTGGYRTINIFHLTESGISVDEPADYFMYCTIIGRKIRNLFRWPSLRLRADAEKCTECKRCTRDCPMSLDVQQMVLQEAMENSECVLCGTCVDVCPTDAIRYSFSAGT